MLGHLRKYKKLGIIEWFVLILMNVSILYLYSGTDEYNNLFLIIVLWFFNDLVEIKKGVKTDLSYYYIYPKSKFRLFSKLLVEELGSIKIISVLIGIFDILYHDINNFKALFLIFTLWILQTLLTILLYHISYRLVKYSLLIRYLFLTPLLALFILNKDISVLNFYEATNHSLFFTISIISLGLMVSVIFYLLKLLLSKHFFVESNYLNKTSKVYWTW